jgi:hypothetical protein
MTTFYNLADAPVIIENEGLLTEGNNPAQNAAISALVTFFTEKIIGQAGSYTVKMIVGVKTRKQDHYVIRSIPLL